MTIGLNFQSQFIGCYGISNHARDWARGMAEVFDPLHLTQYIPQGPNNYDITPDVLQYFKNPYEKNDNLIFWYPHTFSKSSLGKRTFGYFIFEYTKIPKDFIKKINKLDGIFTASDWGVDILLQNKVEVPAYKCTGGISPQKYNSNTRKISWGNNENGKEIFKFLHCGKAENRKGTELVIKAFNKLFASNPNFTLTLSIHNTHISGFNSWDYLFSLSPQLRGDCSNIKIADFVSDMRDLYSTHHCAVYASLGEGIGLHITESIACGMPVIVPFNSGMTEYATEQICFPMYNLTPVPVFDPIFFPNSGEYGLWNSPTVNQIAEKMEFIIHNWDLAEKIGKQGAQWMAQNFTWKHSAEQLKNVLLI